MSASRPSSALKDRRPATSMGFAPTSRPSSAAKDRASSNSGADPSLPPALAPINPSHLRPMSAFSQISLSSRPGSAMSRSTFGGSRLVVLDSLTEGPGTFQGELSAQEFAIKLDRSCRFATGCAVTCDMRFCRCATTTGHERGPWTSFNSNRWPRWRCCISHTIASMGGGIRQRQRFTWRSL